MDHIRGEKVVFGKGDYCSLDDLPSCRRPDAPLLATPRRRRPMRTVAKLLSVVVLVFSAVFSTVLVALEEGYLDDTLTARAEHELSSALGPDFQPSVGSVRLRFTQTWLLGLAAGDVKIVHKPSGVVALKTDSLKVAISPLSLMMGRIVLSRAEIGSAEGDLRFLPAGAPMDLKSLRIDAIPNALSAAFPAIDRLVEALRRADVTDVAAARLSLKLPRPTEHGDSVSLVDFDLTHPDEGRYVLKTAAEFGDLRPRITISVDADGNTVTALNANVERLPSNSFIMKRSKITGEKRFGIEMPLAIGVTAEREKTLLIRIAAGPGLFYADSITQPVDKGEGQLRYDFADRKFVLDRGDIVSGETRLPLVGTLIDLDRVQKNQPAGFAFEVVSNEAYSAVKGVELPPQPFSLRVAGFFAPEPRLLQLDTIGVSTKEGNFAGSLAARFVEPSPAVSFAARSDMLTVDSLRRLWPYWYAAKVRDWVIQNVQGGMVRNGQIDVNLAAGRIPEHPIPIHFEPGEIKISLDVEDAGIRFNKTMPAATKTSGRVEMIDRMVSVAITRGGIPLPSGKTLTSDGGRFLIGDISDKPLMGQLTLKAAGAASAVAEFASFPPINAMSRAPFALSDLTGNVAGEVQGVFGLEEAQHPPAPVFKADLKLSDVSLKKPFRDKQISDLTGDLSVDQNAARLTARADVDGMKLKIEATEPVRKDRAELRKWRVFGDIGNDELASISPSLADVVSGSLGLDISGDSVSADKVAVDLTNASLSVPGIGWRKGAGVAAKAEFSMSSAQGVTTLDDFSLGGEGFGASGVLKLDKSGLLAADLKKIRLSPDDKFAVSLDRKGKGYAIAVTGDALDLRPLLSKLKDDNGAAASKGQKDASSTSIRATLGSVGGYNKESLSQVRLAMATRKGEISTLDFGGVTRSGQAVVVRRNGSTGAFEIASGDAGALARFADVYKNMNGGLLNVKLTSRGEKSWRGSVDIRNFALVNEQRLKSLVSARTGANGESLTDALKTEIDTSSQKFRRGFARLLMDGGVISVQNGIVRGDQVGATFQGVVRDPRGRIDITGTFMPVYGINSLFGQLPIIGNILGNGRDRGLLGITFKLEGPFDAAQLSVNPLSLIAPGVFRNIFEFE
ncbi:DUF3971 domain-containing protein [Rhizobium sp. TRM95796]|uniref:YhdP family protein n=2 Tax=unclassified Rhizobium TaxID=2613769 RepID=UPI0021E9A0BA|nr:DUF3971 domain-containing protein [Rhizobium sp. TRM95796]MCV3764293.1 DUF3971 domain-containing protein [Rhizobium sp. TRM95796]